MEGNSVLWRTQVTIPVKLWQYMLQELHRGHPGIVHIKSLACGLVGLNVMLKTLPKDILPVRRTKPLCQKPHYISGYGLQHRGNKSMLTTLDQSEGRCRWWSQVHTLKQLEVFVMISTSASKTVAVLCETFTRFGIPEQLVWDNGPRLVSDEFEAFIRRNGFEHVHFLPYHPATVVTVWLRD